MRFDLHLHTTASDGHLDPESLVSLALTRHLDAIAVTDHDTTAAIANVEAAALDSGMLVIPGVELSATHNERDVHILGYFIDPDDAVLAGRLTILRAARLARATAMVTELDSAGYHITLEQVLDTAAGGSVGRSHIARVLVDSGHTPDSATAFRQLIGRGKPFYKPKPITAPDIAVRTILDAGGIPVMAHPGVTRADELIEPLVAHGLRGLEAYHADHSPEQVSYYAQLAQRLGLLVTGGSDFHGQTAPGVGLGEVDMPDDILSGLLAAAGRPGIAAG
ncbi:MAG: PHP domain-containing protein [Coriobacteriia bacterium]